MRLLFVVTSLLLVAYPFDLHAQSGPHALNVSGGLFDSTGQPVLRGGINFKLEVRDKTGSCVLYSETHNGEDLSETKGQFSLLLGAGTTPQNFLAGGSTLDASIFLNRGLTGAFTGCPAGVTLSSGDERVIRVYYDLGSGLTAMTPDVPIVSSAYAMVADTLQGKGASDFIQVKDDGTTTSLSQVNTEYAFSLANWPKLKALIDGNSANYVAVGGTSPLDLYNQRIIRVANPGTSPFDAVNKGYADANIGGRTADFSGVGPAIGDGKTMVWDQTAQKWVAGNPTLTGTAGGDLSGTYPNPVIASSAVTTAKVADNAITSAKINTTGVAINRLVATDATTGSTLTYFTCAVGEIMWWTATGWQCTTVAAQAPVKTVAGKTPNAAGNVALNAADITGLGTIVTKDFGTAAGEVPLLDAGAKIPTYMLPAGTGTITAVTAVAPVLGGGSTGNVTISLDVGTAANQIVRLNGSAQLPAVDGSQLTGVNATKIGTRAVSSAAPGASQVLAYNATSTQWEPMSTAAGSVTAVVSGTGLVAGTITSAGTINVDVGTTAGQIVQFDGSARYPANDGSQITNVNATKIGTRAVASTAPAAGQVLAFNATSTQWEPMTDAGGTMTSVTAGTGLVAGTITSAGTLNVDVGTGANKIVQLNGSAEFPAIDAVNLYNVNASRIGTRAVSSAAPGGSQVLGFNATLSQWEPMSTAVGSVTAVVSGTGLVAGTITSSGTLNVDVGTGANKIVQLNGSAQIPAVDGSLLTGVNASKLGTRAVASSSPSANQVLMWNGSQWEPANASSTLSWPLTATPGTTPASAPSYAFASDTDTGVYSPAVDNLALATNGTARLNVDASGRVGIGNASPNYQLHVSGDVSAYNYTSGYGSVSSPAYAIAGSIGMYGANSGTELGLATGGVDRLHILASGNVGIGTSTPLAALDVGITGTNSALVIPRDTQANRPAVNVANGMIRYNTSTSKFEAYENGAWTNMIAAGGGTTAFPLVATPGTTPASAPSYSFAGSTNSGLFSQAADTVALATFGTARLTVDGSGFVGIGTTSPGYALHVYKASGADMQVQTAGASSDAQVSVRAGSRQGVMQIYGSTNAIEADLMRVGPTSTGGLGKLALLSGDGSERLRIDAAGNVGVGTSAPKAALDLSINGTNSALILPRDTQANRPASNVANGMLRYNTSTSKFEAYENGAWTNMIAAGGGTTAFPILASPGTTPSTAPSYSFTGSANTGLYSPAAGSLALATAGTTRMKIDNEGYVLIGDLTTNRGNMLDVSGTIAATNMSSTGYASNAYSPTAMPFGGHIGIGNDFQSTGSQSVLEFKVNNSTPTLQQAYLTAYSVASGSAPVLTYVQKTGGSTYQERFRVDQDGKMGVGNAAPAAILDVAATGTNSALVIPRDTQANRPAANVANGMLRYNTSTAKFEAYENGAWTNMIGGAASVSFPLLANPTGTQAAPAYAFNGRASTGMYSPGTSALALATNGSVAFQIDGNQHIGIGTTPSAYALVDVAGNVNFADGYGPTWATGASFIQGTSTDLSIRVNNHYPPDMYFDANRKVGIGTSSPAAALDIVETGTNSALIVPRGTQANRPAGNVANGMIRYNTSTAKFEAYENGGWTNMIGGGAATFPLLASPSTAPASAPSYSFASSTGTGLYSHATNALSLATSGTARFVMDSAGWVDLGASGGSRLRVYGDIQSYGSGDIKAKDGSGTDRAVLSSGGGNYGEIMLYNNSSTKLLNLTASNNDSYLNAGKFGVGTSTPKAILDVAATGTNSALLVPRDTQANRPAGNVANGMIRYNTSTAKFEAYENGGWTNMIGAGATSFPLLASPGTTPTSAPSYSFTGSTNTGLQSPAAGKLNLVTNGTAGLTVDGNGQVGINSTSPAATLHVQGNVQIDGPATVYRYSTFTYGTTGTDPVPDMTALYVSNTAAVANTAGGLMMAARNGTGYSNAYVAAVSAASGYAPSLVLGTQTAAWAYAERMRIDPTGLVGIGTAAPVAALDIAITGTNSALVVPRDTQANRPAANATNGMIRYNTSTSKLEAYENGGWTNMIGGGAGASFPLLASPGTTPSSAPSYSFTGDTNTGLFSPGADNLALATGGVTQMTIDATGRGGFGTAPAANKRFYVSDASTATSGLPVSFSAEMNANPSGASSARFTGSYIVVNAQGSQSFDRVYAVMADTTMDGSNTVADMRGFTAVPWFNGGTVSSYGGFVVDPQSSGTVTLFKGVDIKTPSATISESRAINIEDQIGSINQYAIYQAGSNDKSYFAGSLGVGVTSPTEKVEITGNLKVNGQAYSGAQTSSAASPLTFNANLGNSMVWTTNTVAPTVNVQNMKPGASYMLVVSGTGTGTVTINCSSDSGGTSLPASFVPANGGRTTGTLNKTMYNLVSDGTNCLVTWVSGF